MLISIPLLLREMANATIAHKFLEFAVALNILLAINADISFDTILRESSQVF